jgi:hypothetical protein
MQHRAIAFLDAATVKRTFAALGGRVPGSN